MVYGFDFLKSRVDHADENIYSSARNCLCGTFHLARVRQRRSIRLAGCWFEILIDLCVYESKGLRS